MNRHGAVLLEVVVAMVILGSAGATAVFALHQALHVQSQLALRERRAQEAARLLGTYALFTADQLGQRVGVRVQSGLRVSVTRPEPGLFRVAVSDTTRGAAEEFVTVLAAGVAP